MTKSMNKSEEAGITKILYNQVSLFIACVGLVSGIMFWVMNPQIAMEKELIKLQTQTESNQSMVAALEKIKQNDLVEIHAEMKDLEARDIEILQAIARLEAKIK